MEHDRRDAARRYRHGLAPEDRDRVPFYAALCDALSESPLACDLLSAVPVNQRNPMLVLAALHYAALSGDARLAPLYGALAHGGGRSPDQFARAVLAVLEADPALVRSQVHRRVQTNEVRRSTVIAAVLGELARSGTTAVNLVDLGTSAGLNLYPDRYRPSTAASADPLTLTCELLGSLTSFHPLPEIRARVGIDLSPLDLADPDDARWLRSCLWPEEPDRLARLARIEELVGSWPARTLLRGSALERLPDALALCDPGATTVVMHTWAVFYFPEPDQRALSRTLRSLAAEGGAAWLAVEWPRGVPGLALPEPTAPEPKPGACVVSVARPGEEPVAWGWCHAHGRWLSLDPPGPKG